MSGVKYDPILDELRQDDSGTAVNGLPVGGTSNQVLKKNSNADYDTSWTTVSGGGDMLKATYDPTNIGASAFNQDNMLDGTTNKNYTATDKTKLGTIASNANVGVVPNGAITGATNTKITYDAKGLVTSGAAATTADIADSTDKRYCTDAQKTIIGNTSGSNSGDNATNSQYSGLAASKQDTLVSTTNIKTINGASVLGSGDLVVSGSTPSGQATVNFGAISKEDTITTVTVNTASVLTASIISITPSGKPTADHDSDDYQWDNVSGYPTNIINGTSFDIVGVAPNGSWGQYIMNYVIN